MLGKETQSSSLTRGVMATLKSFFHEGLSEREKVLALWATMMTLLVFLLLTSSVIVRTDSSDLVLAEHIGFKSMQMPVDPSTALQAETAVCDTWYTNASAAAEDPWMRTKWALRMARCPVQGFLIEELDPDFNFRRGLALGFTTYEEDKTHVLLTLRATVDPAMHVSSRRIYLDLGGNKFSTSVSWFNRLYPLDFTEIHVFEAVRNFFVIPEPLTWQQEAEVLHPMTDRSQLRSPSLGPPPFPNWLLNRITKYEKFVGTHDNPKNRQINITRFIKEELNVTAKDTLVVKMDIENEEWHVLEDWMKDPEMPNIVDELFVEVHFREATMAGFNWMKFNHTKQEAVELLTRLRRTGFYAHAWP